MRGALLAMVCLSTVASAQVVYKWEDEEGTAHFTDDLSTVPKGVKASKVEGTSNDETDMVRVEQSARTEGIDSDEQEKALKKKEREARKRERDDEKEQEREATWRKRFREANQRVLDLDDEITVLSRKLTDGSVPEYSCFTATGSGQWVTINGVPQLVTPTTPYRVYGSPANTLGCVMQRNDEWLRLSVRLDQAKRDVVRAKEDLQELNRQASFQSVPVEWRR